MPARGGSIYIMPYSPPPPPLLPAVKAEPLTVIKEELPTVVKEEPQDHWNGKCVDLSERCSSLSSSDCESLTSSNSFSECDFDALVLEEPEELEEAEEIDDISIPDSELLTDPEGEQLCPGLLKMIKHRLSKPETNSLGCSKFLFPDDLLLNLGQELISLAYSEPCGLRGALIDLCVEQGKVCHSVGQLEGDPAFLPTFQMTVIFKLDSRLWPRIQGLFKPVPGSGHSLKLRPEFKVLKKRLYSSEEVIVDEF